MSVEDTAKKIISNAEIFYQLETGESLKNTRKLNALIYAIAEVLEEQHKIILEEGEVMQESDEWESPVTGLWKQIPPGWIGSRVDYKEPTTFSRQHVRVRRRLIFPIGH